MKPLVAFLGIVGVLGLAWFMPAVMDAVKEFRTDELAETFNIDTGVGDTSGTVTLNNALWNSNVAHASVTSDLSTDSPTTDNYNITSRVLSIGGLTGNATRQVTVTYLSAGLEDYPMAETASTKTPVLLWIAIISIVVVLLAYAIKEIKT